MIGAHGSKTHEVNAFIWNDDYIPFGITKAFDDRWTFGDLPYALAKKMFDQVQAQSRRKTLKRVTRDQKNNR